MVGAKADSVIEVVRARAIFDLISENTIASHRLIPKRWWKLNKEEFNKTGTYSNLSLVCVCRETILPGGITNKKKVRFYLFRNLILLPREECDNYMGGI